MKQRIVIALTTLVLGGGVFASPPAAAGEESCDFFLCTVYLPPECDPAVTRLRAAERRVVVLERRIKHKNATIKRLRAQLAVSR
jgi:hypothetical protein